MSTPDPVADTVKNSDTGAPDRAQTPPITPTALAPTVSLSGPELRQAGRGGPEWQRDQERLMAWQRDEDERRRHATADEPPPTPPPAPPVPPALPPPEGALTRGQAARRLGTDKSAIRRMEQRGDLKPCAVVGGVHYFTQADVDHLAVRARRTLAAGEIAAVAFRRFGEGATLRDLVVELRQPPEVLRALWREWTLDWEAGEVDRKRRERVAREEREAREVERINRSYDRESARAAETWEKGLTGVAGAGGQGGR